MSDQEEKDSSIDSKENFSSDPIDQIEAIESDSFEKSGRNGSLARPIGKIQPILTSERDSFLHAKTRQKENIRADAIVQDRTVIKLIVDPENSNNGEELESRRTNSGSSASNISRTSPNGMNSPQQQDQHKLVGKTIGGGIEIQRMLGRGGMSSVYLGRQESIGRNVAIKVLHPHFLSDEQVKDRFALEAQAVGKLDHQNIIRVHDFRSEIMEGGGSNECSYLVMDYLEGKSLEDEIKENGPLSVERALSIFMQACDACEHAHARGIIHRDLKPSNFMLLKEESSREDASKEKKDRLKLLDFGIAKLLPQNEESIKKLTQTGEIFGSPLYMSPEQCMGKAVDRRSDIYSMGCLIYESLTGKPPLEGTNVIETFFKHTTEMPESIGNAPGAKKVPMHRELDAVILKAMAKDPAKRFQSMEELKLALESILAEMQPGMRKGLISKGLISKAREDIEYARRRKEARADLPGSKKNRLLITGLAAAVLFMLVGAFAYFAQSSQIRANITAPQAASSWQDLYVSGQEQFNLGNYENARTAFKSALEKAGSDRSLIFLTLSELVDLDAVEATSEAGSSSYQKQLTKLLEEDRARMKGEIESTLAGAQKKFAENPKETKAVELAINDLNDREGALIARFPDEVRTAIKYLEDSRLLLEKAGLTNQIAYPRTLSNEARCHTRLKDFEKSLELKTKAEQLYLALSKNDKSKLDFVLATQQDRAAALQQLGRSDEAEEILEKRIETARSAEDPTAYGMQSSSRIAKSKFLLAEHYFHYKNDKDGAIKYLNDAISMYESQPNRSPATKASLADCYGLAGIIAKENGDLDNAREKLEIAIKLFQELPGKRNALWFQSLAAMADVERAAGNNKRALPLYKRALVVGTPFMPQYTRKVEHVLRQLEMMSKEESTYSQLGSTKFRNKSKAAEITIPLAAYRLRIEKKNYGENSKEAARAMLGLASKYRNAGDLSKASELAQQAIQSGRSLGDARLTMDSLIEAAKLAFDSSDKEKGKKYLEEAVSQLKDSNLLDENHSLAIYYLKVLANESGVRRCQDLEAELKALLDEENKAVSAQDG